MSSPEYNFVYPQRSDDLLMSQNDTDPTYRVQNPPRPFDINNLRSDNDSLIRIRERFKLTSSVMSLPGTNFDTLFNAISYQDQIPPNLSATLVDTLATITQTLLRAIELDRTLDWGQAQSRKNRGVIGMTFFLNIQHAKTLVTLLDQNANEMSKDKKQRIVQKAQASAGYGAGGANAGRQWGKELGVKLQKQLESVLNSLYLLFVSTEVKKQYAEGIIDENFVQFTMPSLVKVLTSPNVRQLLSSPTLPRTYSNLLLACLSQYCAPELIEISSTAKRMKGMVVDGFVEMIKQDVFDPKFVTTLITLGFSRFNIAYPFSFFFDSILELPPSDKVTLSELPKALKLLGTKLPARCLANIGTLIQTLNQSQSYSIRNSIIELISSIITNGFVIPEDYHPGVRGDREVIYFRPEEYSMVSRAPVGAPKSADEAELDADMEDLDGGAGNIKDEVEDRFGSDDDDDDDDDQMTQSAKNTQSLSDGDSDLDDDQLLSKSTKAPVRSRKLRYSMGADNDNANNNDNNNAQQHTSPHTNRYDLTKLQSQGPHGTAAQTRQALVELIIGRLDDVHTEARARAVQCLGAVLLTTALPFEIEIKCLSAAFNSTQDRSSKVRRSALMLYRAIIQRTIHPAYRYSLTHSLNEPTVESNRAQLTAQADNIKAKFDVMLQKQQALVAKIEAHKTKLETEYKQQCTTDPIKTEQKASKKAQAKRKAAKTTADFPDPVLDLEQDDEGAKPEGGFTQEGFEAYLQQDSTYNSLHAALNAHQADMEDLGVHLMSVRLDQRAAVAQIHLIQQISLLLARRCLPLLKSLTVTDVEESVSCIMAAFAANMENISAYLNEMLSQCTNSTIVHHVAETWGSVLLSQHQQANETGQPSQIFLTLVLTVLRLNEPAKVGLRKVMSKMSSMHSGTEPESFSSLHSVFGFFLREHGSTSSAAIIVTTSPVAYDPSREPRNGDEKKDQVRRTKSVADYSVLPKFAQDGDDFFDFMVQSSNDIARTTLTVAQSAKLHAEFITMLSFLLFTSLDYVNGAFISLDMPPVDINAIFTLIGAMVSNVMPIGMKLFEVFKKMLYSPHCQPQVTTQILNILLRATLVLPESELKELIAFCVNNVCFGLQVLSAPIVDSILTFDQTVLVPAIAKAKKNKKKPNGKKGKNDDDFDEELDNNDSPSDPDQLIPQVVQKSCIITADMSTTALGTQAQATLHWTGMAEACIALVAKFSKNPLPIFEFILRHLSTVLNELDHQTHYNYILQHAPAFVPSICQTMSSLSVSPQSQPNPDTDSNVLLYVPQQCHCQSSIMIKAVQGVSVTLPPNCSVFDPKSKFACVVLSQQERLTRLFTATNFITMHSLLVIEDAEAKIKALTKKEVGSNLHTLSLDDDSSNNNNSGSHDDDNTNTNRNSQLSGPQKRKAASIGRSKLKKPRNSFAVDTESESGLSDDDNGLSDDEGSDEEGLLSRGGVGSKSKAAAKSTKAASKPTKAKAPARGKKAAAPTNDDAAEDEEEKAGMLSRAEQHIEDNVRFLEKTLTDPNHYLGMAYKLINHVCVARRQFQPSVFYAALAARCKIMLISKDACRDAVPGLLSILRDLNLQGRTLDPEYVTTVKQICAMAIADGAQRFPNECGVALEQLNLLTIDRNETVAIYSLHALASVLLTGMHKPNRALPYICTCLASEYPNIVTVARALVKTLGTKRDGNISLIAISFPDILSRFLEGVNAKSKSSVENPLKVAKELLLYVKTEHEIAKVVKGITMRLSAQLKLNNIEGHDGRNGALQFDMNGQPIIETSTKILMKKVSHFNNRFDRYRFTLAEFSLTGTKNNWKRGTSKVLQNKVFNVKFPVTVHLDLKADVVSTALVPAPKSEYCTCGAVNCKCLPTFQVRFDFISADEHNLLQLNNIESIQDNYNIITTSDADKMAAIREAAAAAVANNGKNAAAAPVSTAPTAQDYFERSKFLIIVLRAVKFNVSSARRFINDFNEYSQACQHPQLYQELKLLAKHIRTCVTRTGVGRPAAANAAPEGAAKTGIDHDLTEWEERIEEEYENFKKKGRREGESSDDDDEIDSDVPADVPDVPAGRRGPRARGAAAVEEEEVPTRRGRGAAAAAAAAAAAKKEKEEKEKKEKATAKKKSAAPARPVRGGRRRPPSEEEEESSSSSESSDSGSDDESEEEEEQKPPPKAAPAGRRAPARRK